MKKKLVTLLGSICLVLVLVAMPFMAACAKPAPPPEKPIELSLSLMVPPTHLRWMNVLEPWTKMIAERTNGKVKIVPYFKEALAKIPANFDAARTGISDLSEGLTFQTPGRFPLSETVMLPGLGLPDSSLASPALWSAYTKIPELAAEYSGVKVLALHVGSSIKLGTTKPVYTLEDLKGLKIQSKGSIGAEMAKALGYAGVPVPMGDVYMSLEKGVIDGEIGAYEVKVSRKFMEHEKYSVKIDLGHTNFWLVMNQKKFDSLPPDIKKVFEELSGDWLVDFYGKGWDKNEELAEAKCREAGMGIYVLPSDEDARWVKLLGPVQDKYAADVEAKGLPGKKVLDELRRYAKEHAK